jgi:uncharacterized protein (DUF2267 family)
MVNPEHHVPVFETTLRTTHDWLQELELVASLRNRDEAYAVLRRVLHALRDRLPTNAAVHLGAELPMLIRGFYYEGWKPSRTPTRERSLAAFLARVHPLPHPDPDFDARKAVESVFAVLDHRIAAGEVEDIRGILPRELQRLWPEHA